MKGDQFIDSKNNNDTLTATATPNMFSKLNHHQPLHHHHHQQHPFSRHFPLSSEEEATSHTTHIPSTNNEATPKLHQPTTTPPTSDGATIEVVRRPRGRPPGSKNKPKPPVIITRDQEPSMSPYILEVPSATDVVEAISRFCRRKNVSLCILSGTGAVSHFTLRNPCPHAPHAPPGAAITFHGRFDILSMSATFMPQTMSVPVFSSGVAVSLSGPQGQIIGGTLAGPLVAAGPVYVVAATLSSPSYHRLSGDEEARNSVSGGSGGEGQSPPVSGGGESGQPPHGADSGGAPMYSCHLPSDVIWAPSARQQAPY